MNASYEWLRAFVDVDASPAQLRDLLTAHAVTVEDIVPLRTDLEPIMVARVVKAVRHPDSDHLWLTQVDAGGPETLEVVCGAPNVTEGALYPFAPVGTTMPNGMKIERRKIRGIVSNGMLCSARELGLGEDHQGILQLDVDAAPGARFLSVMPGGDVRLELDVGANRADLQSHLGVARELSAITGKKWHLPEIPALAPQAPAPRSAKGSGTVAGVEVRLEPDSRVRRYMAAVIRGVTIGDSPEWLVRRLHSIGMRSINNVVDATNYVLHELGQPIHAFDLVKLQPPVIVRRAKAGEQLVTLDGTTRKLPADSVVIADSQRAHAVAGVMGGRDSEVTAGTKDLLIEVASFDPRLTRSARKALGLITDASYRFERGVDPQLAPMAVDRVVRIIMTLAGGKLEDVPVDVIGELPEAPEISLRAQRVAQVLGVDVSIADAARYLERAGFEITSRNDAELRARVPSWRADVTAEIDLVEEVARYHGYDRLPDEIRPFRPTTTYDDPLWLTADRLRTELVALGLLETRPMPFVPGADDSHVRVANPLSENEAHLRKSLLETLTRRAEYNLARNVGDVRIFEIGSAFAPSGAAMPREQLRLGVLVMGRRRPVHFTEPNPPLYDEWDAKAVAEIAARSAYPGRDVQLSTSKGDPDSDPNGDRDSDPKIGSRIDSKFAVSHSLWTVKIDGRIMGHVMRVSLDAPVWAAPAYGIELVLGEMETDPPARRGRHSYKEAVLPGRAAVSRYRALPTMPAAEFDLALLVPNDVRVVDVERVIRIAGGELLEGLDLFDQYTGAGVESGHRSLAWRLTFRHPERTLRDKEIEGRRRKVLDALQEELNVRQRSA